MIYGLRGETGEIDRGVHMWGKEAIRAPLR